MLSDFLQNYLPIIIFLVLALGLSCAFVVINFILSPKKPDPEKLSAYECGFEPFEDSRMEFDVRFYEKSGGSEGTRTLDLSRDRRSL